MKPRKQTKCPLTAEDTYCDIMKLALYNNENNLQKHSTQVNFKNTVQKTDKKSTLFKT